MPDTATEHSSFLRVLCSPRMLVCVANGFAAGMPLFYLYHLIPAWLRDSGVDLKTIGLFALIGMPYSWKFIWAPFMDRFKPFFLGRRRGWMLITQIGIITAMAAMALCDPAVDITPIIYLAGAIAFLSASQDIVLDAYRKEFLPDRELGIGNGMYMNGYRAASLIPGGLGLILADYMAWPAVHLVIAGCMGVVIIKTFVIREPEIVRAPTSMKDAIVEPFKEFFSREGGIKHALLILLFLALYKLGDNMATALTTPFYMDIGYSKTIIGSIVKTVGLAAMLIGGVAGGWLIYRIGINKSLYVFGAMQTLSILGFAILAQYPPNIILLGVVHGFEYIGVGLGASGMIAFMARQTHSAFTASQFALLSSIIAVPRTFANAFTGFLVEGVSSESPWAVYVGAFPGLGWVDFFLVCALLSLPGIGLLYIVAPWKDNKKEIKRSFSSPDNSM